MARRAAGRLRRGRGARARFEAKTTSNRPSGTPTGRCSRRPPRSTPGRAALSTVASGPGHHLGGRPPGSRSRTSRRRARGPGIGGDPAGQVGLRCCHTLARLGSWASRVPKYPGVDASARGSSGSTSTPRNGPRASSGTDGGEPNSRERPGSSVGSRADGMLARVTGPPRAKARIPPVGDRPRCPSGRLSGASSPCSCCRTCCSDLGALANPAIAAPDEDAHLVKALGMSALRHRRAQPCGAGPPPRDVRNASITRVVEIPGRLDPAGYACFIFPRGGHRRVPTDGGPRHGGRRRGGGRRSAHTPRSSTPSRAGSPAWAAIRRAPTAWVGWWSWPRRRCCCGSRARTWCGGSARAAWSGSPC